MTPEQMRAVAGLADALTECERVGLPAVHVRAEGDPEVIVPVMRLQLGSRDPARRGWQRTEMQLLRTLGGTNPWQVTIGEPS